MNWKKEIKKQDPKLALETLLREITRDRQGLDRKPDDKFDASLISIKISSYQEQVEKVIQMM
mgnify:CR=1 FL=1